MKAVLKMGGTLAFFVTVGLATPVVGQNAPVAEKVEEGSLKGKTLTFVSYGGIYQDGQMKALEAFAKRSGVRLLSDGPTEVAKIQAQVESRNVLWDVIDIGDVGPLVHCETLFQKLDFSKIDISKVPPGQVTPCSVPAMNYAVLFMYKTSTYGQNPPKSWADFFDMKKFPGTRAIPGYGDAEGYMIELALLSDGVPKDKLFPADIERGLNKYRQMRDHLILWQTGAQSQQMLESGEADMIVVWSGRGRAALANGAGYTPVWQDWVVLMDQLTIPVGAKNPDASHALIDAYLGQKSQEIMTEATSYSPVHVDAKPTVDPLTAQWLINTPEKHATVYQYNLAYWVEHNAELNEKWAAFITGN